VAATLALLARAAAGAANRPVFEEAWSRAWAMIRHLDEAQVPPAALVDLSRAAAMLGDWERMEQAVRRGRAPEAAGEAAAAHPHG
jgi:hypothetical protein